MASSARFSLERTSALSRPPERAGRVPCDPKAAPRIRVSTIRPSPDVRPTGVRGLRLPPISFVCGLAHRLTRWTRGALRRSSNRADERLRARAIARELFRQAASRLAFHPFVARGVAHGGRAVVHCDGCAVLVGVASRGSRSPERARRRVRPPPALQPPDGSSADDSVKPSAAPSPSSDSAFRREIISILASSFISGLPVTHDRPIGSAVGRTPAIVRRPETQSEIALRLERPSCRNSLPARDNAESPRLAIVAPANPTTKLRLN